MIDLCMNGWMNLRVNGWMDGFVNNEWMEDEL